MVEGRWLVPLGPPVVAVLALGALTTSSFGATDRAWDPPACAGGVTGLAEAARAPARDASPPVPAAWFTLDPVLDASGELAGQRLRMGLAAQRGAHVELPAESSAAGPFGRVVLVVADDGRRSEVRAIDREAGCAWPLGGSADVVRSVTLDRAARAVVESRVDRTTRADLGVWQRPWDGSPPQRVLEPLARDAGFGPTFTTTLAWSAEGDRLVVESCGASACRVRIADLVGARTVLLHAPGRGALVGVAGPQAVGYAACGSLPCPLGTTEVVTGRTTALHAAAGLAALVTTPDGPRVAVETAGVTHVLALDGRRQRTLRPPRPGLQLVPSVPGIGAGTGLPADWIAWTADGRTPEGAVLARVSDGRTVELEEVLP